MMFSTNLTKSLGQACPLPRSCMIIDFENCTPYSPSLTPDRLHLIALYEVVY